MTAAIDRAFLARSPLPAPAADAEKDARGTVLIVAGSREVPGAALLAGRAVLRAGAGKLQIATVASMAPHLAIAIPEARVVPLSETGDGEIDPAAAERLEALVRKAHAVLIGPGMIDEDGARRFVHDLLGRSDRPFFVLDAAAITGLGADGERLAPHAGRLVLTPHAGEMASLLGETRESIEADPAAAGRRAAARLGAVVAMKGPRTFVCGPDGSLACCEGGGPGLATGGSGDVLAGLVAGFLARGAPPLEATAWAVHVHAEAGRRLARRIGTIGFLAGELSAEVPHILDELA